MGGVGRRLRKLEERAGGAGGAGLAYPLGGTPEELEDYALELERRGWSIDDQVDQLLRSFWIHVWGNSRLAATDRQMLLVEALIEAGQLSRKWADRYFGRMSPALQAKHETMLFSRREEIATEVRRMEPRVAAYVAKLREEQDSEAGEEEETE